MGTMAPHRWWIVLAVTSVLTAACTQNRASNGTLPPTPSPPELQQAWSYDTGSPTSMPSIADGMVFVATKDGRVLALTTGCGLNGATCAPTWVADTGRELRLTGVKAQYDRLPVEFTPPVVTDGVVVVQSMPPQVQLFAFDTRCGTDGSTCTPLWIADVGSPIQLVASDGLVYVQANGEIEAYSARCGRHGATCSPAWTIAPTNGLMALSKGVLYVGAGPHAFDAKSGEELGSGTGSVPKGAWTSTPTVGDGVVVIAASQGFPSAVFAYSVDCLSTHKACAPLWTATVEDQFLSWMGGVIENGRVFFGTEMQAASGDGHAYAFQTDCRFDGGPCEPSLAVPIANGETTMIGPVSSGHQVLFTSLEQGFIEAFSVDAGLNRASSDPLWRSTDMYGPVQPVIVDEIAYVADSAGSLRAFSMACVSINPPCQPLASYGEWGKGIFPPVAANGYVYVGSREGELLVFMAPAA